VLLQALYLAHCGHSTISDIPVGYCKAAKTASVQYPNSEQQRTSMLSISCRVYSRADSMEAEEPQDPRGVSIAQQMQPCNESQIHPLQTRRFERLCTGCQHERDDRLDALDSQKSEIRFEPWKWQFRYQGGSAPANEANSYTINGTTWAVTTTLSNLIIGSPGWMRDWKRQDASIVG